MPKISRAGCPALSLVISEQFAVEMHVQSKIIKSQ